VRELINNMAQDKCIVLSTHILEEVDAVCNRAIIIADGKIVADATPEALRSRSRLHGAVTLSFREDPPEGVEQALRDLTGVKAVEYAESTAGLRVYTVFPDGQGQTLAAVVNEAESRAWPFENLRLERGELDEVFRDITQ
jgi:ABC-2 type transport system ATP-binding protein